MQREYPRSSSSAKQPTFNHAGNHSLPPYLKRLNSSSILSTTRTRACLSTFNSRQGNAQSDKHYKPHSHSHSSQSPIFSSLSLFSEEKTIPPTFTLRIRSITSQQQSATLILTPARTARRGREQNIHVSCWLFSVPSIDRSIKASPSVLA